MKRLQEKVKVLMNSTYSSLADHGLTNSQFADLSSVSEDEVEESKGTQYQNLGQVQNQVGARRAPGTARGPARGAARGAPESKAVPKSKKKESLASPFELAPAPRKKAAEKNKDVILLSNQDDPISKSVQHYFIDKKHQQKAPVATQEAGQQQHNGVNQERFNVFNFQNEKQDDKDDKPTEVTPQHTPKKARNFGQFCSPRRDKSWHSDQKSQRSQDSNVTMAQIQKMTGMSSFASSGSSALRDDELLSTQNEYSLTLKVHYKTEYGQEIAVVGSIPQLGCWDPKKALRMKWTDGHCWVVENINISEGKGDPTFFMYKYALLRKGKHQFFERGFNRIADLKLLKQAKDAEEDCLELVNNQIAVGHQDFKLYGYASNEYRSPQLAKPIKKVQILDCWEYYQVNFQVFNPMLQGKEEMQINGDHTEIGSWHVSGPRTMTSRRQRSNWLLKEKYGHKVKFNQFPCQIQNHSRQMPVKVRYNYSKRCKSSGLQEWEREPCRTMEIQDPQLYKGQLRLNRKNSWLNCHKVWVVNGQINKIDSNFRVNFKFSKIADTRLYVGNCPVTEDDVIQLAAAGVKGVLSLKSQKQDHECMRQLYEKNDIHHLYNCPIPEFNQIDNLAEKLLEAVKVLDRMRKQLNNQKIFVHCTAGMTRSPTLVILYLCLYCQVDFWKSPVEVYKYVKEHHYISYPNMKAIFRVIARNRTLQYHQCLLLQAEYQQQAAVEEQRKKRLLEQAKEQQHKLDTLMVELEERRQRRKVDRKERLHRQQRSNEMALHRDQLQIEAEKLKLRKLQKQAEESREALNRTNEMLRQNLNDQSNFLDDVSNTNEWPQREGGRTSLGAPAAHKITPRHQRKPAGSGKKNKSCTPQKSKHAVPVSILNIDIFKELQAVEAAQNAANSKEQSQRDNSLIKMLQKSQNMYSEIESKELDSLEPPTKSFDEGLDKSDRDRSHNANDRSLKCKPNIFNYHGCFLSQEHSPIRSRQNMRYTARTNEHQAAYETAQAIDKIEEQDADQAMAKPEILRQAKRSTQATTAVQTRIHTTTNTAKKSERQDLDPPQRTSGRRSPIFEDDSLDAQSQEQAEIDIQVDAPPREAFSLDPGEQALPKRSRRKDIREDALNQEISELESMQHEMTQNTVAAELPGADALERRLDQADQAQDNDLATLRGSLPGHGGPALEALQLDTDQTKKAEFSPVIHAKQQKGSADAGYDDAHEIQEFIIGSGQSKQMAPYQSFKDGQVDSERSLKLRDQYANKDQNQLLQELNHDSYEPEDLQDQFRLIDQIQRRSNQINQQIKEQIEQKRRSRESSPENQSLTLRQCHKAMRERSRGEEPQQPVGHHTMGSIGTKSKEQGASQQEVSPNMSEARELLHQNKQDLDVIKAGSPESRFMESFVSQRIDPKFTESFQSSLANKATRTKDKEPQQFKVDTTYPADDFDSIQKNLKLERYMSLLGVTKQEVQLKSDQMFGGKPPIPFKCRPHIQIDIHISEALNRMRATIPVLNVRGSTYLIGIYKFSCSLNGTQVLIKNQQGQSEIQQYLAKNQDFMKQMLVIQTILCKQNLDYVINSLMVDQGIPKLQQIEKEMALEKCKGVQGYGLKDRLKPQSDRRKSETSSTLRSKRQSNSPKSPRRPSEQLPDPSLRVTKHQTTQNSPQSRNKKEAISSYNSTPVKSSPGKNHVTINVQAYKPKQVLPSAAAGYQPLVKEQKTQRNRAKINKTQSNTSRAPVGESRNKPSRGNVNLIDCAGTTQSQRSSSSKQHGSSQIQIKQAREQQKLKLKKDLKELAKLRPSAFGRATFTTESSAQQDEKAPATRDADSPMYRALKQAQQQPRGTKSKYRGDPKRIQRQGTK